MMSNFDVNTLTTISAAATLTHCPDRRMTYRRGHTTWDGKPGAGTEHDEATYQCECGALLVVLLSTPC